MVARGRGGIERHFDTEAFPAFSPLLEAVEDYAELTGSRFRSSSFDHFGESSEASEDESRRVAKTKAAPLVESYSSRVKLGEEALLAELRTAHSLLMAETVRNAMVSTCKRLDCWPPHPALLPREEPVRAPPLLLKGAARSGCATRMSSSDDKVAVPFPIRAQRLFEEDEVRGEQRRVARTAAFLVEFMAELAVPQPDLAEGLGRKLQDFTAEAAHWEQEQARLRQLRFESQQALANLSSYLVLGAITTGAHVLARSGCAREKFTRV